MSDVTPQILVVEDEPVGRALVRAQAERLGYAVVDVPTGEAALDVLAESRVDLVLMDGQLPGIDGLETTRRIRAAGWRVPVVALTASVVPGEPAVWRDAGMDDVCAKPVSLAALRVVIERWVGVPPGNVPLDDPL